MSYLRHSQTPSRLIAIVRSHASSGAPEGAGAPVAETRDTTSARTAVRTVHRLRIDRLVSSGLADCAGRAVVNQGLLLAVDESLYHAEGKTGGCCRRLRLARTE
jgi:hypothetical protein